MTTLRIPGQRDPVLSDAPVDRLLGRKIEVRAREAVRLEDSRAGEEVVLEDVAGDAVLEVELAGGLRLWLSVDQMQKDLAEHGRRRGGDGALVIPGAWPAAPRSRGAGAWAVKLLKVLDVDLAGMGAKALAAYLEGQLEPGPGLYRCPDPHRLADRVGGPGDVDASGPVLLFVHGTASRTAGSFGGLAEDERRAVWKRIRERYGDRVYAFEHKTLTRSPLDNARELASLLPAAAEVHVVSHSRGGLVGELLCQSGRITDGPLFDADDLRQFDDHGEHAEDSRRELEALGDVLRSKRLRVGRFVRVACPARGTTLASRRLDRYLSIALNAVGLIPALKASQTYDFLKTLVLGAAKKRIDPTELPGLEAQMPTSPLVRVLNRQDRTVDADLSVIAGDLEGRGLWGRLKTFATDLFYREDHDLVVNTSAMYGGAPRPEGRGRFFFDQGQGVNHFQYFRNEASVGQLETALAEAGVTAGAFRPIADAAPVREITRRVFRGTGTEPRPVVFLLPGIMGTHLRAGDNRIWVDLSDLAKGRLGKLHIDAVDVEPDALVGGSYLKLIEFLEGAGHEVVPFPYDWRLSILRESRRFADAVAAKLAETEASGMPIRVVAHSMGGLVARAMIAQSPSVWRALEERPGSRLLMLGTPNGGSYTIPRVVLGRERVLRLLALIDLRHNRREVIELVTRFPGLLELLPVDGGQDFFDLDVWRRLEEHDDGRWVRPKQTDLRQARRLRRVLDASPIDPERMIYVAGQAPATPISVGVEDGRVVFRATPEGDGRVPWRSGPPAGVPTWYMHGVKHGRLADHRSAFQAIDELLKSGATERLATRPPAVRAAGETFVLAEDDADEAVIVYPDAPELLAAAVGDDPIVVEKEEEPPLRVEVAHGDLAFAQAPVAVGHYLGDSIVSAEGVLDRQLDHRLSRRHRLGLYPGPIGTSEVVLDPRPGAKPGGAIVVGLGRVGELTRGGLASSFAQAVLAYAIERRERPASGGDAGLEIELVSLLIGSSEAGLAMDDSIEAMLEGVRMANTRLREERETEIPVRVGELTFVELWEDRAVEALRALDRLSRQAQQIVASPAIRDLGGGRRRVFAAADQSWWLRLVIAADTLPGEAPATADIAPLKFSVLGKRARSEVTSLAIDRRLVDGMIEDAMKSMPKDPEVGSTFYELLVPNELKRLAPDQRDLVLVVDEQAARYPWELLVDRVAGNDALSLRSGLIRQLSTEEYRPRVVTPLERRALVIGDPPGHLPELKGAQEEARSVIGLLEPEFEIPNKEHAIRPSTAQVLKSLLTEDYRLVHLAGHGEYDPRDKSRTGMVIGEHRYLTPAVVDQMRQVPELVFLNCCHLGFIGGEGGEERRREEPRPFHRLAANLGTQLIRMGVRAVVAAGWPVDDAAARTFAATFYRQMLDGVSFGQAVLRARRETHAEHGDSNTWGAYQCYGDPSYRLVRGRRGAGGEDEGQYPHVAPAELIAELDNLVSTARAGGGGGPERLLEQVTALDDHRRLPAAWRKLAAVETAFARAYAELAGYRRAIDHYRRALVHEDGGVSLADVEQLANMEVRWGEREGKVATVEKGLRRLRKLLALGRTSERLSLLGAGFKRLAKMRSGKARIEALERMRDAYREGYELKHEAEGEVDTYPLLNYLTGRVLVRDKDDDLADLPALLEAAERAAAERFQRRPDFWNAIIPADIALVRSLAAGDLGEADRRRAIVEGYLAGRTRASSPREFDSVLEHVDFLIAVRCDPELTGGRSAPAKRAKAECEALRALEEALAASGDVSS